MRTESEMLDLILRLAKEDERVRAVGMNGSRINPNAPVDPFQDFDIVYLVNHMQSFIEDPEWVDVFGDRLIMQTPEAMALFPSELGERFSYLMLFTDGNRLDLILAPIQEKDMYEKEDSLTILLLDKDDLLPETSAPTDQDYWVSEPTGILFDNCCNEFWWVSTYVAKGLWRKEILYALDHINLVRNMLIKMLEWRVGFETDYSVSIGKNAKYLEQFVDKQTWLTLLSTYPPGEYEAIWGSLFKLCELFIETATYVANSLHFDYPYSTERNVMQYLRHIKDLPSDATVI
ncbi:MULTISPECIES: aminoglycoside 6-adenylyltransferase [Virgibacillus]|uniref:Aminoglycoside 6-adenylyltransferase n=2 Tax=Virgibacillus TaxID=84406 RepID=A0A024QFA9_9BACI|nr:MULTISPECIES: aminoglycoside 6-adenylyltransferase [Virgibacillus]EQB37170.1 hypothetical protein M948_09825 [Virgibacillus sp. CM-4]GGJ71656.1 aminoglycoside 6-adenylyltransferase [Virgibacillus kapii]CDQ41233.1 Aminoglycoside 6-adenylyltransferase [Virgibacillus massiliensis]